MCDSGRAGAKGGRQVKNPPRSGRRRSRLDPCSTPPDVLTAPPDAARHLAESFLLLRGLRREITRLHTVFGWLSCLRATFSLVPCPCSVCFQDLSNRVVPVLTLPRWFTLLGGRLYEQCAVTITLGTLPEAAYRY
jgi:hypothetical protein